MSRSWILAGCLALLAMGAALRLAYPSSDCRFDQVLGIGTVPSEDGYMHSARLWALGIPKNEEDWWDSWLVGPLPNALAFLAYKTFGVSSCTARTFSGLLGVLALGLLAWAAARYVDRRAAVFALVLAAANPVMVAYFRVGLL